MLLVDLVVLALTGAWLWFEYRPPGAATRWVATVRGLHGWAATLALWLGVPALTAGIVAATRRLQVSIVSLVLLVTLLLTAGAALFSGYLLPWNQIALWAVKAGDIYDGIEAAFEDGARFVLVGDAEIGVNTYRRWALVHVGLGILVVALCVVAIWIDRRRRVRHVAGAAEAPPDGAESAPSVH